MLNPTVTIPEAFKVSHEQFKELAIANRDLRLERTEEGELVVIPLNGGEAGAKNTNITGQLWLWNRQSKIGIALLYRVKIYYPNLF
ncbi:hypothetical protein Riv7116_3986 [Rivularia sp. PCC 7116]|uniref:Uma2 family endonuclease n=1 Tax=Rivularia sp. PCC 7116 TaxID=373994 RepID=UPI00029EF6B1|nr:Uma2 family endonuclease [Rivularia sp. PCC 7116]AFY56426.1 hypothetical protein Riv7116_3986 [Rivularia sp. PCC 7116]